MLGLRELECVRCAGDVAQLCDDGSDPFAAGGWRRLTPPTALLRSGS